MFTLSSIYIRLALKWGPSNLGCRPHHDDPTLPFRYGIAVFRRCRLELNNGAKREFIKKNLRLQGPV